MLEMHHMVPAARWCPGGQGGEGEGEGEGGNGAGRVFGISFRVIPKWGYLPKELCVFLCTDLSSHRGVISGVCCAFCAERNNACHLCALCTSCGVIDPWCVAACTIVVWAPCGRMRKAGVIGWGIR